MVWEYKGEDLTTLPDGIYGFVYMITYTTGQVYYGKKNCYSVNKKPALKTGEVRPNSERIIKLEKMSQTEMLERTPAQKSSNVRNKRVPYDMVKKEAKWQAYKGSSEDTKDLEIEYKEILAFSISKRELTYLETKCLFQMEALEDPNCLNKNIGALFYRDNLD